MQKRCSKIVSFCLTLGILLTGGMGVAAAAEPPTLDAAAYVLMDGSDGQVLAAVNADAKRFPASTTKIMTLVLALEAVRSGSVSTEDQVTTSEYAASMGGSQVYLFPGETRTLEEMLIGVAVGSGNDACVAVAEFLAGSEESFVEQMNAKAAELGMSGTHFVNPHGLHDENHYTTAGDMAKLAYYAVSQVPEIIDYTSIYEYDFRPEPNPLKLWSTNKLLKWYNGVDGLKTGFTSQAGRNLVASATRDELRLLTVVMGVEPKNGHFNETIKLLDYGFNTYKYNEIFAADTVVCAIPVVKGERDYVDAKVASAVGALLEKTDQAAITSEIVVPAYPTAPVEAGAKLGEIQISKDGEVIRTVDLVAAEAVEPIGFKQSWQRSWQRIFLYNSSPTPSPTS